MSDVVIDLMSDTSSKPTPAMRRVMADAEVGDEQRGEDPTVNRLCDRVADLLGKEAALFLPSGTMCNQISLLVHCRPGDEIIAADTAHIDGSEGAGAAVLAGASIRLLPTANGTFTVSDVEAALRPRKIKAPRTRVIAVEQTSNRGGGSIWPLQGILEISALARTHGLAMHMDGARLLNAVVASGVSADAYAAPFDSAWLDLSKGLGCPFGAVLAGSKGFIDDAWVWKHRLGGAMRQAGIMAAAGVYALDHHVDRLAEDHENAQLFANQIAAIPGISLCHKNIETNLVFFDIAHDRINAAELSRRLLSSGIRIGVEGSRTMRAVTHIDVDRAAVEKAAAIIAEAVG